MLYKQAREPPVTPVCWTSSRAPPATESDLRLKKQAIIKYMKMKLGTKKESIKTTTKGTKSAASALLVVSEDVEDFTSA